MTFEEIIKEKVKDDHPKAQERKLRQLEMELGFEDGELDYVFDEEN